MKNKLIILSFILSILLLTLFQSSAGAESYDNLIYTLSNNEVTITGCHNSVGTLVIPEEIAGYPVTRIDDAAFYRSSISGIVIPETVKYIGEKAFYGCESLAEVTFNAGKPEFEDADWIFPACCKLKTVKVTNENKDYIIETFGKRFTYVNSSDNNSVIAAKDENWYILELEKQMLDAWRNFSKKVDNIEIYNIPDNANVYNIILNIANEHTEYYYIATDVVAHSSNYGVVISIDVIYRAFNNKVTEEFKQEVNKSLDAIDAEIKKITSFITDDMTDLEKAVYVHDYMVMNYDYDPNYDPTHYNSNDLDQVLSYTSAMLYRKVGVCSGYARTYKLLMDKLGIECKYVSGKAIENDPERLSSDHAWNIVKINKKWYYIDVTWDEQYGFGLVCRKNLLKSYDTFSVSHSNYTYSYNSYCLYDDLENVHWINAESAVIPVNNKFYYITNGKLYEYTNENSIKTLYSSAASDSGLAYYNNKLYFNTVEGIKMMNLETKQVYLIANIPNTSGLVLDGNVLKYGTGGKYSGTYAGEIVLDATDCFMALSGDEVRIFSEIPLTATVITAYYKDKQMTECVSAQLNNVTEHSFVPQKRTGLTAKVMILKSFANPVPLCNALEIR